jgi:hypothetical protein
VAGGSGVLHPLAVGAPADLALWATDRTLSAVLAERARPDCRLLLVAGEPIGEHR